MGGYKGGKGNKKAKKAKKKKGKAKDRTWELEGGFHFENGDSDDELDKDTAVNSGEGTKHIEYGVLVMKTHA